ncbi:MAG: DUF2244 domain-containing protein [Hyphomicrobiaceae bacterium]
MTSDRPADEGQIPGRDALFRAVLTPNSSLGREGFRILMGIVIAINLFVGLTAWSMGAWPIFGFCGLDVALFYWAFKANYRAARRYETVEISHDLLEVTRVDPAGNRLVWQCNPYWARVELVEYPSGADLKLVSGGRSIEIARVLGEEEKRDFASALKAALHQSRHRPA